MTYQLGWFSTGRDNAALDLLTVVNEAIRRGEIKAELAFVFCDREPGESPESDSFIRLVNYYHLPLVYFSYKKFKTKRSVAGQEPVDKLPSWRLEYDREVMKRLKDFKPDLCVLAGYMLIVGREMCQRYNMINLHPAAPGGPVGTCQEVIWRLIDSKAGETGVMMHLVTPELDKGPVVAYCTFSIRGEPFDRYWRELEKLTKNTSKWQEARNALFNLVRQHGLAREFPLIISTIKAFSQGKISITNERRVVDIDDKPINGYNMTNNINKMMQEEQRL